METATTPGLRTMWTLYKDGECKLLICSLKPLSAFRIFFAFLIFDHKRLRGCCRHLWVVQIPKSVPAITSVSRCI